MKLEVLPKPAQTKFQFASDRALSRKMTKVPMYADLLNRFCTSLVVGKQGSGKTSFVLNLLTDKHGYKGRFDKIFVFLPGTSLSNVQGSPYEKLDKEQIFDELDFESLSLVYEDVKERAEANRDVQRKQRSLIIFDDVSSEFKNKSIQQLFKRIVKNQRHLYVSSIFIMQSYFDMPKQLRQLCNNLFLFKMSKAVMHSIFEELIELAKSRYDELIKFAYDDPHAFLAINMNNGNIYKGFDRVCFEEDDEGEAAAGENISV
eukprot:gene42171-51495_t